MWYPCPFSYLLIGTALNEAQVHNTDLEFWLLATHFSRPLGTRSTYFFEWKVSTCFYFLHLHHALHGHRRTELSRLTLCKRPRLDLSPIHHSDTEGKWDGKPCTLSWIQFKIINWPKRKFTQYRKNVCYECKLLKTKHALNPCVYCMYIVFPVFIVCIFYNNHIVNSSGCRGIMVKSDIVTILAVWCDGLVPSSLFFPVWQLVSLSKWANPEELRSQDFTCIYSWTVL